MANVAIDEQSPAFPALQGKVRFDAIFAAAMDAIICVDSDQRIVLFNPAAEWIFKCPASEALGSTLDRFIPTRFRDAHRQHIKRFGKTGVTERRMGKLGVLKALRADGEEFSMEASVLHTDACGEQIYTVIVRDITERELHDAARRDAEERLKAVLENVIDGVVTIDEHGIMQSVNPSMERLFGYSAAELQDRNVALLMPEPYRSGHDGYLQNYLRTGQAKIIGIGREVTGRRKDGSTFPMDLAVSEFRLGGKRFFTGLVRDITERKTAEARLKFYAEALEAQNAELERSNQELDDFAYIASHDLKEPLRGIHNYAAFLIEDHGDKLDYDGHAKLATINRLAQRLENLIDSLLVFSRVGRVELAIRETDLNEIVAEVLDSLTINLQEQGVKVSIPAPLPNLCCDRVRIAEVFRNLIANAMKYNDKAEKCIEIGVCPADRLHNSPVKLPGVVALYVRDNGIGIREKHLESVFRIFKRLHSRDQYGGGTGAGLTIVKKIVERHGGQIWVESTLGAGSTFYFTLTT